MFVAFSMCAGVPFSLFRTHSLFLAFTVAPGASRQWSCCFFGWCCVFVDSDALRSVDYIDRFLTFDALLGSIGVLSAQAIGNQWNSVRLYFNVSRCECIHVHTQTLKYNIKRQKLTDLVKSEQNTLLMPAYALRSRDNISPKVVWWHSFTHRKWYGRRDRETKRERSTIQRSDFQYMFMVCSLHLKWIGICRKFIEKTEQEHKQQHGWMKKKKRMKAHEKQIK